MSLGKYEGKKLFVVKPILMLANIMVFFGFIIKNDRSLDYYYLVVIPSLLLFAPATFVTFQFLARYKREYRGIVFVFIVAIICGTAAIANKFDVTSYRSYIELGLTLGFFLATYISLNAIYNEKQEKIDAMLENRKS